MAARGAAAATLAERPCLVRSYPGPVTGADYLGLLHDWLQRQVWQHLHSGPLDLLVAAKPWCQVNVLTCGRSLTAPI